MCQHRKWWNILEKQYKTKAMQFEKAGWSIFTNFLTFGFPHVLWLIATNTTISPPQTLLIALPFFTAVIYCLTPREYLWWFWFDWMCCLTLDWSHPVFAPVLARRVFFVHQMTTNMICCNNRQNGYFVILGRSNLGWSVNLYHAHTWIIYCDNRSLSADNCQKNKISIKLRLLLLKLLVFLLLDN